MPAKIWVVAIASVSMLAACGSREESGETTAAESQPAPAAATDLPDRIVFQTAGTVPEGVEFDAANRRFLVGSLAQGTVFVVHPDGSLEPFVQDPELKSSVGIEVDAERGRLLVANSDRAVFGGQSAGQAKLGIYDLETGERQAMIDLASAGPEDAKAHFANDVTVGADGSAYVTDSFARVIYRVDPANQVSVFVPNMFKDAQQHMFNGIVFHPSGFLLVAESRAGDLYKVPLDDPKALTKVKLPEPLSGADGMVWHPDGRLIVVRNDDSRSVVALSSTDDWASATVAGRGTFPEQGTTAAIAGDQVYVVHPQFADPNAAPSIGRVRIE